MTKITVSNSGPGKIMIYPSEGLAVPVTILEGEFKEFMVYPMRDFIIKEIKDNG